jgi:hypothetical protein
VAHATGSGKPALPPGTAARDMPGVLAAVACGSLIVVISAWFIGVPGAPGAASATLAVRSLPALGPSAGIDVVLIALLVVVGPVALSVSRRLPEPALFGLFTARTVLGLAFLVGADALMVGLFRAGAGRQHGQELGSLLALMAWVALLGPVLIAVAGLALAGVRGRTPRMAPPVIPIALGVVFAGTVYFLDATIGHAALVQEQQRLASVGQILVRSGTPTPPGNVAGDLVLGVLALLAAVALVTMIAWRPAAASAAAVGAGIAAGAITLITVSRAVTGGWPYLPLAPAMVMAGSVLALAVTAALSRPARPRSAVPGPPAG